MSNSTRTLFHSTTSCCPHAPTPVLKSPLSSHCLQLNPDPALRLLPQPVCVYSVLEPSARPARQSFFSSQFKVFIFFHVIPYSATTSNVPRAPVPLAVTICSLTTSLQLLPPEEFVHSLRSSSTPQEPTTAHITMGMLIVLIDDRNQYPHT